jgi:hypothetical protein
MAEDSTLVTSSVALWPGLVAAGLGGALAAGQGPGVAAGVAGLLALPMGMASLGGAALLRGPRARMLVAIVVGVAGPAFAVLGAVLKANTHHKALAGVTFAVVALGVVLGGLALGGRLGSWLGDRAPLAHASLGLAGLVLGALLWRGGAGPLDVALLLLALAAGASLPPRPSRVVGGAALGVWVAMITLGLALGLSSRGDAISQRSLLASGALLPLRGGL